MQHLACDDAGDRCGRGRASGHLLSQSPSPLGALELKLDPSPQLLTSLRSQSLLTAHRPLSWKCQTGEPEALATTSPVLKVHLESLSGIDSLNQTKMIHQSPGRARS